MAKRADCIDPHCGMPSYGGTYTYYCFRCWHGLQTGWDPDLEYIEDDSLECQLERALARIKELESRLVAERPEIPA